ncbi:MAG: hypothetical protein EOP07_08465 [Proteobacteria bacterium]|nr:MAG: hypothetical protein EOP07_08465 [Pseudomonadota bacterium]
MKKPKKTSSKRSKEPEGPKGVPGLLPHQDPDTVRNFHIKQYKAQLNLLNKANEKIRQHVEVDQPAFTLWWQQEFADELNRQMELEKEYMDLRLIMDAIEQYKMHYTVSYREASAAVTNAHLAGKLSELMQTIFNEIDAIRNQHKKRRKTKTGLESDEEIFQKILDDLNEQREAHERSEERHAGRDRKIQGASAEETTDSYLKSVYKDLVRILHPDAKGGEEQTAEEKVLWHDLQKAYEWRDIEKMESIHRAINGEGSRAIDFAQIPIGDIVAMKESLVKNLKVVNKDIRAAKSSPNWEFKIRAKKKTFLKYLYSSFEDEMIRQTMVLEMSLEEVQRKLRQWSSEPRKRR